METSVRRSADSTDRARRRRSPARRHRWPASRRRASRGAPATTLPPPTPTEVVAHELRTPLTALLVAGHVLLRDDLRTEVRRQLAQDVVSESERLAAAVEDLLALVSSDAGGNRPEPVSLPRVLRTQVARASDGAGAGTRFRVFVPSQVPVALADEELLAHLVRDLLALGQAVAGPDGTVEAVAAAQDGRLRLVVTARPGPRTAAPARRLALTESAVRRVAARLGADLLVRVGRRRFMARAELPTLADPQGDAA